MTMLGQAGGVAAAASQATLERNLAALGRMSPETAEAVRNARGREDLEWSAGEDGAATASLGGRALASRRRPIAEAETFAAQVDAKDRGVVVALGFGVGHHVGALATKLGRSGVTMVFEPDVDLLRSVLERVDHAWWLERSNVVVVTDAEDAAALNAAMRSFESVIGFGVAVVEHPASVERLRGRSEAFTATLAGVMATLRTALVTTLVQTETTVRNVLMNLGHYAERPGIRELEGACIGRPALVVSAGPSLRRNMALLARPGVREKCVIIAVQTALKPLLAAGIRPHFVTALDHHEISRRFYEGLTAADVEGVTLVAEPKANPAILDAFPGAIRCPRDEFADLTLGADLVGDHGRITPGATVAHLAYYLARRLGCDPVGLIGQDLGFTDGQYYAAGAAIHGVWAGELNPFHTLEALEWQRIVRSRSILRRMQDHLGRPIYSDEQMAAYLAQFERDFREDESMGLRTIDATEGGVRKAHTERMRLAEFLDAFAGDFAPPLPELPRAERADAGRETLGRARRRLREVRSGVWRVGEASRRAERLLAEMLERQDDQARVGRLIDEVYAVRDAARNEQPGYELVQRLNQTGAFKRARADRAINLDETLEPVERQRRQIERDIQNVRWLADAADALGGLLDDAVKALDGGPKRTRDLLEPTAAADPAAPRPAQRVAALLAVDTASSDAERMVAGRPALRRTLERLSRCERLRRAVILTDDPSRCRALVGAPAIGRLAVEFERAEPGALRRRRESVRAARAWALERWRGGIANLTCYDEAIAPEAAAPAMERLGIDAALVVGAGWALVDPALCDAVIERHAELPDKHRFVFTQAAPGLAGAIVDRVMMADLAAPSGVNAFATLGGATGYIPVRPRPDPIAMSVCVPVDPRVRDACPPARLIADGPAGVAVIDAALRIAGEGADAGALVAAADRCAPCAGPRLLTIETSVARATSGRRLEWAAGAFGRSPRAAMDPALFDRIVAQAVALPGDVALTLDGLGDPLEDPRLPALVAAARSRGVDAVHVRTDLLAGADAVDALLRERPSVISVDLLANRGETYERLAGAARFGDVLGNLERLHDAVSAGPGPLPGLWVTPRITRCDAVYEELEAFYDRWTMTFGGAVIDPMPAPAEGERIEPLPLPPAAARRVALESLVVRSDGRVIEARGAEAGDLSREPLDAVWRRALTLRGVAGA